MTEVTAAAAGAHIGFHGGKVVKKLPAMQETWV